MKSVVLAPQKRAFLLLSFILIGLVLLFNNCSGSGGSGESGSGGVAANCGENLSDQLKNPQTIDQTMLLIKALPKPLTIDCFLRALKSPLQVYAVDNTFSAQPSAGVNSPRIFIINNKLILSVVPAGVGSPFLELSEVTGANISVKGELRFPITSNLPAHAPYSSILDERTSSGTSCKVCHSNESRNYSITTGEAYNSLLIRPDSFKRVSQAYLKDQALNCNSGLQPYRCAMLRTIFIDGAAQDANFP